MGHTYPPVPDTFDVPSTPEDVPLGEAGDSAPSRNLPGLLEDLGASLTAAETELESHKAGANPHPVYATDADLANHAAAADPHPAYATDTDLANHAAAADPHPTYETSAEAQAKVDAHAAAANPHPTYATDADLAAHAAAGDPHAVYATDADLAAHAAAADPHPVYTTDLDPLSRGFPFTVDPRVVVGAQSVGSANRAYYSRTTGGGAITKVRIGVVTSSGNISVGAYDNTGAGLAAAANNRQTTSGAVACPAAGLADVTVSPGVTVQPSWWFAISADNTTATFSGTSSSGSASWWAAFLAKQDTAHPLPAAATPVSTFTGVMHVMIGV